MALRNNITIGMELVKRETSENVFYVGTTP